MIYRNGKEKTEVAFDVPIEIVEHHPSEDSDGAKDDWCLISEDGTHFSEEDSHDATIKESCLEDTADSVGWEAILRKFFDFLAPVKDFAKEPKIATLRKPQNALVLVHLTIGIIVLSLLIWDRYSWRSSASILEDELRQFAERELKPEAPNVNVATPESLKLDDFLSNLDQNFHWEDNRDNVVFDNCWGSFTLGECASETNRNLKVLRSEVQHTAGTIAKHAWKVALKLQKQATEAAVRHFPAALASNYYPTGDKRLPKWLKTALEDLKSLATNLTIHVGNMTEATLEVGVDQEQEKSV